MKVVLYDGVCHLCDGTVKFLLRHDKKGALKYAALQSDFAQSVMQKYGIEAKETPDSILFLDEEKIYAQAEAALRILKTLGAPWSWLYVLNALPLSLNDFVYQIIAKNRYRWFGKADQCMLPQPEWKDRFLG